MRQLKQFNWPVLLLALAFTLALLLGGNALLQAAGIEGPLIRELKALPGVSDVTLGEGELQVRLAPSADLAATYQAIASRAERYELVLVDDRDAALAAFYSEVQFALFEGLQTGRYVEMKEQVDALAAAQGLTHQLSLDDRMLYLSAQHEGHSLFVALQRGVLPGE